MDGKIGSVALHPLRNLGAAVLSEVSASTAPTFFFAEYQHDTGTGAMSLFVHYPGTSVIRQEPVSPRVAQLVQDFWTGGHYTNTYSILPRSWQTLELFVWGDCLSVELVYPDRIVSTETKDQRRELLLSRRFPNMPVVHRVRGSSTIAAG